MDEHLTAELIHLTCPHCRQITTLSYGTLVHQTEVHCGYCGLPISFDIDAVKQEARRKAHELDQSPDSLGSTID
jgi:transcription elongation factor Elf1